MIRWLRCFTGRHNWRIEDSHWRRRCADCAHGAEPAPTRPPPSPHR